MADGEIATDAAASVIFPLSATATKYRIWRRVRDIRTPYLFESCEAGMSFKADF
jgi:hypothetical protein